MKIYISPGNKKLGNIPNFSLMPVLDCGNAELCKRQCYDVRVLKYRTNVRLARMNNSNLMQNNRDLAFSQIRDWFISKGVIYPLFFRIHVGGDFLDQDYLERWYKIAYEFSNTKFLAFTKMFSLDYDYRPDNLSIVWSMWPGLEVPPNTFPKAWLDSMSSQISPDTISCPGKCSNCGICWDLERIRKGVSFKLL